MKNYCLQLKKILLLSSVFFLYGLVLVSNAPAPPGPPPVPVGGDTAQLIAGGAISAFAAWKILKK